jgi:dipeptidyl aminopeptidase/acylaminoacyl peptidase
MLLLSWLLATAVGAVPAPVRPLTDPKSLTSRTEPLARPVPVADLFYSRQNRGGAWSPDGKQVVLQTNLTGRFNLWTVSATGSWPQQLTRSDDPSTFPVWSPDGRWIVYSADRDGNETYDLYAVPADGGESINLTASDNASERYAQWSPDSRSLAFELQSKDASTADVAIVDLATHSVRKLTHEQRPGTRWSVAQWSRDGRFVYANRTGADMFGSSPWRIEVSDGHATELVKERENVSVGIDAVSADGTLAVLTTNQRKPENEIALLHLASGRIQFIVPSDWDEEAFGFSPDGKKLLYAINADGRTSLYQYDLAKAKSTPVGMPDGWNWATGNSGSYSPDGTRLLVSHQDSVTPSDMWIVDLTTNAKTQLTRSAVASIAAAKLPAAQLVHYASFDGTVISAFVWVPSNIPRDGHAPAVVLTHGGPLGQTLDEFNREAVALVSRGYVCIAANVRGSSGYGLPFQNANHEDLGGGDLQDAVFAARFLIATGYVDARRIGITGGSYGGFLALMAVGRTPDTWAAAVDEYGITDWFTMQAQDEPSLRQYDFSLLGDPVKNREIYSRSSPITYFDAIRAPVLVLQGENDVRVPKAQAEAAFGALTKAGKNVSVHFYPGEGHGFMKRENQIDAIERMIAWFDLYLKKSHKPNAPLSLRQP